MSIKTVASRAIRKNPVKYLDSSLTERSGYMKLINYVMEAAKAKGKYNRVGVVDHDSQINVGDIVTVDLHQYIVGNKTPDIYKNDVVRYVCELLLCDVTCDVTRRALQRDAYDNIIGSVDTIIHHDLLVSWQVSDLFIKGERDQSTEYYNAVLSIHHYALAPILPEDRFLYYGQEYEAKYLRHDTAGAVSVRVEPVTA